MSDTIQKRAFKNTAVGLFSFGINMALTFISVPILLHYWGKEVYGLWLSLFAGLSLLKTLDLGHQNYVGNKLNMLYHVNIAELKSVLGSSLLLAYLLGLIEMLAVVILIMTDSLHYVIGASSTTVHLGSGLLAMIGTWFIFGSAGGIIVRLLIPVGRLFDAALLGILMMVTQSLLLMMVAIMRGDLLTACIFFALGQSVIALLNYWYVKIKIPELYPWWQNASWKTGFENFKKSLILTINGIAQQLSNQGLVLFIAVLFQASVIPIFTTIRTLTNTAGSITNIFMSSLLPDLIKFHAKQEQDKLLKTLKTNWFISGAFVNLGIVTVLPVIEILYNKWTNGQLIFNFSLFLILATSISKANFGSGLNVYLAGINNLTAQVVSTVTKAILIFTVTYAFVKSFGLISIGFGILSSEIVASIILPIYFVNAELRRFNSRLEAKPILLALIPPAVILFVAMIIIFNKELVLQASMVAFVFLLVIYYCNWKILDEDIKNRFSYLLNPKKNK